MAVVTVRSFAALREVVGALIDAEADSVADLVAQLTAQHGDEFTRRLARSMVVVDGETREHDDRAALADGAEIALLPPFAGGA